MPVIQKIEESKRVSGRYLIWLGEKELLRVTAEEVLTHGLHTGLELTDAEVEALSKAGQHSAAKTTAASMISRKPMSRGEVLEKLRLKGFSQQDAEDAVDWLEELGVLDDEAYAALVVRHYSAKGYGIRKLQEELWRRKVPRSLWSEALNQRSDEEQTAATIDRLIQQKLRGNTQPDQKELARIQGFLLRRGFGWSEIGEALDRIRHS